MGEQVGARIHCKKQLRLLSIYKAKLWILELPVIRNIKRLMFLMADKNQSTKHLTTKFEHRLTTRSH